MHKMFAFAYKLCYNRIIKSNGGFIMKISVTKNEIKNLNAAEIDNAIDYPENYTVCNSTRNHVEQMSTCSLNAMKRHPIVRKKI